MAEQSKKERISLNTKLQDQQTAKTVIIKFKSGRSHGDVTSTAFFKKKMSRR